MGEAIETYEEVINKFDSSQDHDLQNLNIEALVHKAELLVTQQKIEDLITTHNLMIQRCSELRGLRKWDLARLEIQILLCQGNYTVATDSFQLLYTTFKFDKEAHVRVIINVVTKLVAGGVSPDSLLEIISSNDARENTLRPLLVALKLEAGEEVHTSGEILEIASDVRKEFQSSSRPPPPDETI